MSSRRRRSLGDCVKGHQVGARLLCSKLLILVFHPHELWLISEMVRE